MAAMGGQYPRITAETVELRMKRLVDAQRGDHVVGMEDMRRGVLEAERLLWEARCEVLRGLT